MAGDDLLRIAGTAHDSIVDGPGVRFTVFTQGCRLACVGCHNPETQPLCGGRTVTVDHLLAELESNPLISGLTLSGGEPSLQPGPCADLAEAAHVRGLSVWCWSGYTAEMLLRRSQSDPQLVRLLRAVDVLVDGPFILAQRTLNLPWRGSGNQRLISMKETLTGGSPALWAS